MCGILGVHRLSSEVICWKREKDVFQKMLDLQKHRGPDDQGIEGYCFGRVQDIRLDGGDTCENGLDGIVGFRRLSIRDLSLNGHQPMKGPDGKKILAFNGEIYNADEYRTDLVQRGWHFRSTTDTEVVLAMYYVYGLEKTLALLNGMFAIIIVDLLEQKLFLARDRFGIKPLYYTVCGGRLYYASEYKSFLLIPGFVPEMDMEALYECSVFISSPNRMLLKKIKQVCPGEVLTVKQGHIWKKKYFCIDEYVHDIARYSFQERQEMLEAVLDKAVRRQMIGDVKVGSQLSGGVDSSLVSYFASHNQENPMKDSVSIVFRDECMNEEKYVVHAAETLDLEPHRYVLETDYIVRTMYKTIWHLENIMTVPNCNALLLLTEKAKAKVTVLLSGEGADEVFGGYNIFTQLFYRQKYRENGSLYNFLKGNSRLKRSMMGSASEDVVLSAIRGKIYVEPQNVAKMLNIETDGGCIAERCSLMESFSGSDFDKLVKYEMSTYLPELLLRQDKMSMANSIENRVPFLDNEVVRASFSIPYEMMVGINKRGCGSGRSARTLDLVTGKYILKELCAQKFGEDFSYRPKGGFGLPLKYYMGTSDFIRMYKERILPGIAEREMLNTSYVEWLYQRLPVLDWQEVELLWRAINVEIYAQLFLDGKYLKGAI